MNPSEITPVEWKLILGTFSGRKNEFVFQALAEQDNLLSFVELERLKPVGDIRRSRNIYAHANSSLSATLPQFALCVVEGRYGKNPKTRKFSLKRK
jgi:hypothetical protein